MNHCKTCRFFERQSKWWDDDQGNPAYLCAAISDGHEKVTHQTLAEATCMTEGILGELVVTEEFGCVLHEERKDV
jgi:hypothetical protein